MSDRTRLIGLCVAAFGLGAGAMLFVGFGLRFLWVAYGHGGFW